MSKAKVQYNPIEAIVNFMLSDKCEDVSDALDYQRKNSFTLYSAIIKYISENDIKGLLSKDALDIALYELNKTNHRL